MNAYKFLIVGSLVLSSSGSLFAKTHHKAKADTKQDVFQLIDAPTLAEWTKKDAKNVVVYDANNAKTREKEGTIPNAKLLSSFNKFEVSELTANKDAKVVFFCANEQCMASHAAAERAHEAGYKHAYVMSDGIMGWKQKGFPSVAVKN